MEKNFTPIKHEPILPSHHSQNRDISGADRQVGPIHLSQSGQNSLLITLERLLAIETLDIKEALTEASDLVASALRSDKVDVFLYDSGQDALIAMGISQTPIGRRQQQLGLDRLFLVNGGRTVLVYQTQQSFLTGHAELDLDQLIGIVEGLGLHSVISVPLLVKGELRGVIEASAIASEAFSEYDLRFLEGVAGWISIILHRSELTQQILAEARAEARRATAEELVTIIAHDLRNYFTPLTGWLGLLRKRALRDKRSRDLEDINRMQNVFQHLNRMVGDLLDVGRLELGPFSLIKKPLELVSLVKEVTDAFNSLLNPIVLHTPLELYIEADAQRIRQVLENLLANALKFSPEGIPIEVRVGCANLEQGWWAKLTVSNKGPGIDAQVLAQLFQRFVKTPDSSGLGLGLYLAQQIALAHEGTLTADSTPETGTTFTMTLPVYSGSNEYLPTDKL